MEQHEIYPNAFKMSFTKDSISLHYACAAKDSKFVGVGTINIENIEKDFIVTLKPKELMELIPIMLKAANAYQKQYGIDLGINVERNEEKENGKD